MSFIHFRDINLKNKDSYKGKKILSFDIDWAIDDGIQFILDIIEKHQVKVTFFVTHESDILKDLKKNPLVELGIHPNFNFLIENDKKAENASYILDKLLTIVPNTKVLRSHSLTTSSRWIDLYKKKGIKFISNYMAYGQNIVPYSHINGLIECPIYFSDDGHIKVMEEATIKPLTIKSLKKTSKEFLKVYDFHPIHVILNTNKTEYYESTRHIHRNWQAIQKKTQLEYGVRNILIDLLK